MERRPNKNKWEEENQGSPGKWPLNGGFGSGGVVYLGTECENAVLIFVSR